MQGSRFQKQWARCSAVDLVTAVQPSQTLLLGLSLKANLDLDVQSEATSFRAKMLLRGGLVTSQTCLLGDPAPPGFLCMRGQIEHTADTAGASFPMCSYYMTILFPSAHIQWHCVFISSRRRKLLYEQGYSLLFSPVCLQGSAWMPMFPKQPGNEQHTVVLLGLSKTAFPLSSACPNFLSPGDLSQGNSRHYFFLFFLASSLEYTSNSQPAFLSICNSFHQAGF